MLCGTELNCSDDSSNSLTIRSDDSTEKCCEVPQMQLFHYLDKIRYSFKELKFDKFCTVIF